jgi:hypothetical protein
MDDPIAPTPHETVFWCMPGDKLALRHGNWKIVKPSRDGSIELSRLAGDPSESRNLVSEQPERTKDLINRWYALNVQMRRPIELPK